MNGSAEKPLTQCAPALINRDLAASVSAWKSALESESKIIDLIRDRMDTAQEKEWADQPDAALSAMNAHIDTFISSFETPITKVEDSLKAEMDAGDARYDEVYRSSLALTLALRPFCPPWPWPWSWPAASAARLGLSRALPGPWPGASRWPGRCWP